MQSSDDGYASPLARLHHPRLRHSTLPYSSSIAACASASATSVWSHSSQSSQSSQSTADSSDYASSQTSVSSVDSCDVAPTQSWQTQQPQQPQQKLPCQLRQNPRRTGSAPSVVPTLLRQSDRRTSFVDHLVDASTQIVQAIWPLSSVVGRAESGSGSSGSYLLPLRTFIQETLRRSRASYSTLQVALYYLLLIKPRLPSHNFTMEQPSDSHACRALQCGRRMFLAALILASKYLQDRNYSARAWSKISGLSTVEINQNETAFLHAVDWRLHITNDIYNRWMDCVNKFNPPQLPPSPGPSLVESFEVKCEEFRLLIQKLTPSLDNLDELCPPCTPLTLGRRASFQTTTAALSPVSLCSSPLASSPSPMDMTSSAKPSTLGPVLSILEPSPAAPVVFTPRLQAPALGLLPTPKLAASQQPTGAMAQMLSGSRSSMCYAVAQVSNTCSTQFLDRWPCAMASSTSPIGFVPARRSSLANSVSTASSPESMISDSSLVSRCSSASTASWLASAAPSIQLSKLDTQARHRFVKRQCSGGSLREKSSLLRSSVIPAVREDDETEFNSVFASPEMTYMGPVGKETPASIRLPLRRTSDHEAADAARALAELQQQPMGETSSVAGPQRPKSGLKRSRPLSVDNSLQDNVRELLRENMRRPESKSQKATIPHAPTATTTTTMATLVSDGNAEASIDLHVAARAAALTGSRKRLCRTATVAGAPVVKSCSYDMDLQRPLMSELCGPGMWQGILN